MLEDGATPKSCAVGVVDANTKVLVSLEGLIDPAAEVKKLTKNAAAKKNFIDNLTKKMVRITCSFTAVIRALFDVICKAVSSVALHLSSSGVRSEFIHAWTQMHECRIAWCSIVLSSLLPYFHF